MNDDKLRSAQDIFREPTIHSSYESLLSGIEQIDNSQLKSGLAKLTRRLASSLEGKTDQALSQARMESATLDAERAVQRLIKGPDQEVYGERLLNFCDEEIKVFLFSDIQPFFQYLQMSPKDNSSRMEMAAQQIMKKGFLCFQNSTEDLVVYVGDNCTMSTGMSHLFTGIESILGDKGVEVEGAVISQMTFRVLESFIDIRRCV